MMTLTEDQPDVRVASQGFAGIKWMMTLTEDQPDVRVASQGFCNGNHGMVPLSSTKTGHVENMRSKAIDAQAIIVIGEICEKGKRAQKWDLRLFRPRGSSVVRPLPSDSRVSSHACTGRFQGGWTRSVRMR
eukprot:scaffold6278_cov105-Cylindrotheca_fusiformis.AAC.4